MSSYKKLYEENHNPTEARKAIYEYAQSHSLRETALKFECHVNTVKKIKRRGKAGEFESRSHAPKVVPSKLSDEVVDKIIEERKKTDMGSEKIKEKLGLKVSALTVYRHLKKRSSLIKETKKDFASLERFYFFIRPMESKKGSTKNKSKPLYLLSVFCSESKAVFSGFSEGSITKSGTYFVGYFLEHIKKYRINPNTIVLNTSFEFDRLEDTDSNVSKCFKKLIHQFYGAKHYTFKKQSFLEEFDTYYDKLATELAKDNKNRDEEKLISIMMKTNRIYNLKTKTTQGETPAQTIKSDCPKVNSDILFLDPVYLNPDSKKKLA
jgi:transposase